MRIKAMTTLREHARGRDCQVRIIGVCNFDPSTTVLAHVRMAGLTGMGLKANDLAASWCCSACHDETDRRTQRVGRDIALMALYEGVLRTQAQLVKHGILKVPA